MSSVRDHRAGRRPSVCAAGARAAFRRPGRRGHVALLPQHPTARQPRSQPRRRSDLRGAASLRHAAVAAATGASGACAAPGGAGHAGAPARCRLARPARAALRRTCGASTRPRRRIASAPAAVRAEVPLWLFRLVTAQYTMPKRCSRRWRPGAARPARQHAQGDARRRARRTALHLAPARAAGGRSRALQPGGGPAVRQARLDALAAVPERRASRCRTRAAN